SSSSAKSDGTLIDGVGKDRRLIPGVYNSTNGNSGAGGANKSGQMRKRGGSAKEGSGRVFTHLEEEEIEMKTAVNGTLKSESGDHVVGVAGGDGDSQHGKGVISKSSIAKSLNRVEIGSMNGKGDSLSDGSGSPRSPVRIKSVTRRSSKSSTGRLLGVESPVSPEIGDDGDLDLEEGGN
ncbi:hypothetical protein HDU76_007158, partial [Blyttiomyces sp. JEL0837]